VRRALAFLTLAGSGQSPDARTLRWFPVVGALIGLVVGGAWWGADRVLPPLLAAAVVVVVDLVLTGMLHLDGVADSADGLLPHLDRERRLAVMAEPTTGAFAVTAVAGVLLLRTAALASRPADVGLLVAIWAASRSVMAGVATTRPYARPGGLASSFLGDRMAPVLAAAGIAAATVLAGVAAGRAGVGAIVGLVLVSIAIVALAQRRLGGFTGDVLGAVGVLGETVALVVAAARW
jgi:adenosylcobinamide-GDP ribazoletransferase